MPIRRPKTNKNPPIFSHEFVIQNHADIVSCVAMVFVVGLMFQATSPVASLFVAMQHNFTVNDTEEEGRELTFYTYGFKDVFTTIFYFLICIVIHAVIQEYVFDKLNRKMHLSKVKHSKFNESGQLLAFYAVSAVWGVHLLIRENYVTNIGSLWDSYPQNHLPFLIKFYFLLQLAYWFHCFPELYFQKVKKDEMWARIQYTVLYLVFIGTSYILNLTRVGLCLMVLHYFVELVFHLARLVYYAGKQELANTVFFVWDFLFVLVRLSTIILAVLTFWYGLANSDRTTIDFAEGNFNIQLVRIICLSAICLLQFWLMWNFIMFHLERLRDKNYSSSSRRTAPPSPPKDKKKKAKAAKAEEEVTEPSMENSVSENGNVRARVTRSKQRS